MKGKVFFENFNFLKNYFFCTFNAVEFESIVLVCKLFYAVNVNEPYTAYFGDFSSMSGGTARSINSLDFSVFILFFKS